MLDSLGALIAVGLLALTLAGRSGAPRLLLTLAFTCYVPGRALVSNWRLFADWAGVAMSLVGSIVIVGLAATVALWAHFWHPVGLFEVEAVCSLAALAFAASRRHRRLFGAVEHNGRRAPAHGPKREHSAGR